MNEPNRAVDFLNDIYKNAQTGSESITFLKEKVSDPQLLADLQYQHKEYNDITSKAVDALSQQQALPKGQSPMMQVSIWSGVQMNTMMDKSPDKIAEMMIQGSMMGVIDMTRKLRQYGDTPQNVQKIGQDLIKLEENSIQKMKQYLG